VAEKVTQLEIVLMRAVPVKEAVRDEVWRQVRDVVWRRRRGVVWRREPLYLRALPGEERERAVL
jgi:hypothetical protein